MTDMLRPLALAALLALTFAAPVHAQYRSPQLPITGTTLQDLLNGAGQSIDVTTQQREATAFSGVYVTRPPTYFLVRPLRNPDDALAVFDAFAPWPSTLYPICPAGLPPGWYTEVYFDDFPNRMVVNSYDQNGTLMGTASHPGLAVVPLAFATTGPGGVFTIYETRNPDLETHLLAYWATTAYGTWLCAETRTAAGGGDFDFADAVFLLEGAIVTPVRTTTWGTLKQRFR